MRKKRNEKTEKIKVQKKNVESKKKTGKIQQVIEGEGVQVGT